MKTNKTSSLENLYFELRNNEKKLVNNGYWRAIQGLFLTALHMETFRPPKSIAPRKTRVNIKTIACLSVPEKNEGLFLQCSLIYGLDRLLITVYFRNQRVKHTQIPVSMRGHHKHTPKTEQTAWKRKMSMNYKQFTGNMHVDRNWTFHMLSWAKFSEGPAVQEPNSHVFSSKLIIMRAFIEQACLVRIGNFFLFSSVANMYISMWR